MSAPPKTANMSTVEKLTLLRTMATDDGRAWEATLLAEIIRDIPTITFDTRSDPDFIYSEPVRLYSEQKMSPIVTITIRNMTFTMRPFYVPSVTFTEYGPPSEETKR